MEDSQITITQASSKLNILIVIAFFIIFVPSAFHPITNIISLYILIPFLFLYSFITYPKLIINYKPIFYLLLLLCWSLITMIKSKDLDLSIREIRQFVGVFLVCFIFVRFCFINTKYIYFFYFFYILRFLTIFYYAQTHGLQVIDDRFNLDELNANSFGYYGFFAIFSAFFLWQLIPPKSLLKVSLFILFVLCLFLSVMACFYAASRAGIIMSVLMATSLIIIYFFYPFSKKYIWGIILLIIIGTTVVPILNHYYTGSILEKRMQIERLEDETRYDLAKRAIVVGFQNPLFGVGPANYMLYSGSMSFSHSTYTELFANSGIVALLLFISILYHFYKKNRHLYSIGQYYRKNALYFYCFILLYSVYNFFYGFHKNMFMMGFLFIVLVHLEASSAIEET